MAADTLSPDFDRNKPFYVYLYRDPRNGRRQQPIYVGKGTAARRRAEAHWRHGAENNFLRKLLLKIKAARFEPIIEIVAWFDNEDDAFTLEKNLIRQFGRRNLGLGPLTNLTDGGEGVSGLIYECSVETRRKLSAQTRRRWADPDYVAKMRAVSRRIWSDPNSRKRQTEVLSEANRRPEVRARRNAAVAKAHEKDPTLGSRQIAAAHSPEVRARARVSVNRALRSEEFRAYKKAEMLARWQNTAKRENNLAAMRAAHQRPEEKARKKASSAVTFDAKREKLIAATRAAWADPVQRAARIKKITMTKRAIAAEARAP